MKQDLDEAFRARFVALSTQNQVLHNTTALFAHKKVLEAGQTGESQLVKIALNKSEGEQMLFVKMLTGKVIECSMDPSCNTVSDLKLLIL